jgi:hypothetical protein
MRDRTIDGRLLFAYNAITNAMGNSVISQALARCGYDEERLQQGMDLYNKVQELNAAKEDEYGDQYAATDALVTSRVEANKMYTKHLTFARIAFKNEPQIENSLMLKGARADSYSGWLQQANVFYTNALKKEKIITGFALMGITRKELEKGQAMVKEVEQNFSTKHQETTEAQDATRMRDRAFDELNEWVSDLITVSRIALDDKPEYMEMLGVVVKN